ncbi:unnamed protein product [Effrenium voratum]|nr:unnamed protein product [Effrenium voratum]
MFWRVLKYSSCLCFLSFRGFLCKRTLQAAVATGDGYSYCRQCALDWFRAQERSRSSLASPTTGEPVSDRLLLPNFNLREAIASLQRDILPVWDEAQRERSQLRGELAKLSGKEQKSRHASDYRLADAEASAAHFQTQWRNVQQEVQRLQMELERYHHVMEKRDVSGRDAEAKAEMSRLAAELRSSNVEVKRLQDELEKTRQQAKGQAEDLEALRQELRAARLSEQNLQQELARAKHEASGSLRLASSPREDQPELARVKEALAESQALVMTLQAEFVAARLGSPASSPKPPELPAESLFQAEVAHMQQALRKQDDVIADLQTQITALRSQTSRLKQLADLREQRRLESQDEILRLRGELLTIERRNCISSELERTAELATREAERLEQDLDAAQRAAASGTEHLRQLAQDMGAESDDDPGAFVQMKVREVQVLMPATAKLLNALGLRHDQGMPEALRKAEDAVMELLKVKAQAAAAAGATAASRKAPRPEAFEVSNRSRSQNPEVESRSSSDVERR